MLLGTILERGVELAAIPDGCTGGYKPGRRVGRGGAVYHFLATCNKTCRFDAGRLANMIVLAFI